MLYWYSLIELNELCLTHTSYQLTLDCISISTYEIVLVYFVHLFSGIVPEVPALLDVYWKELGDDEWVKYASSLPYMFLNLSV